MPGEDPDPRYLARVAARLAALRETLAGLLRERNEFVWEIGCGHGHFLAAYAAAHPDRFCVGIDILSDRLRKAEAKCRRAGLGNVALCKAEAGEMLACLPAGTRIRDVFLLFPDPWPKKRHHKNRLVAPPFLTELRRWVTPGARLYFRTDHEGYLEWARDALAHHPAWELRPGEPWPFEETTVFQKKAPSFGSLIAAPR